MQCTCSGGVAQDCCGLRCELPAICQTSTPASGPSPPYAQVFTMRFNPEGDVIASGSHDKHIFLWRTYGDCENYMMLKGGAPAGLAHSQGAALAGCYALCSVSEEAPVSLGGRAGHPAAVRCD